MPVRENPTLLEGYPKNMKTLNPNFPEDLDSAVVLKDVVHLFKGWKFTKFKVSLFNVCLL